MQYYQQPQSFWNKLTNTIKAHERLAFNIYMFLISLIGFGLVAKIWKTNGSGAVPEPINEPLNLTVEPLEEMVEETVHEPFDERLNTANEPLETVETEDDEKERIRQAMSLLGKRSGEVRRVQSRLRKKSIKDSA